MPPQLGGTDRARCNTEDARAREVTEMDAEVETKAGIAPRSNIIRRAITAGRRRLSVGTERGAATAEYAITIMAAVGFAGLLVVILRSEEGRGILTDVVRSALSIG